MRLRIDINDHETLQSLARKYPGHSIRWFKDVSTAAADRIPCHHHPDQFQVLRSNNSYGLTG